MHSTPTDYLPVCWAPLLSHKKQANPLAIQEIIAIELATGKVTYSVKIQSPLNKKQEKPQVLLLNLHISWFSMVSFFFWSHVFIEMSSSAFLLSFLLYSPQQQSFRNSPSQPVPPHPPCGNQWLQWGASKNSFLNVKGRQNKAGISRKKLFENFPEWLILHITKEDQVKFRYFLQQFCH